MRKLKLENYIELLDRLLQKEGLTSAERDELFNHRDNIDLISHHFSRKTHPKILMKELNREPVYTMYSSDESIDESKIVKESLQQGLTPGQQYAVDFLKTRGLTFISSLRQIKKGTLLFKLNNTDEFGALDDYWGIYKTGYIRKGSHRQHWGGVKNLTMEVRACIRPPQAEGGGFIDDEEYIELTHMLSQKIQRTQQAAKNAIKNWGPLYKIKKWGVQHYKNGIRNKTAYVSFDEAEETIKNLKSMGFYNIQIYGQKSRYDKDIMFFINIRGINAKDNWRIERFTNVPGLSLNQTVRSVQQG